MKNNNNLNLNDPLIFNQWLAGLIDANGCFLLSKKGYSSLEITMDIRDERCLFFIKNKYGGSLKLRSGSNSLRYRLHHKQGLLNLLQHLNGHLRHSTRILQFNKILHHYHLPLISTLPLDYYNGWLSGFFDGDGSVTINKNNLQLSLSIGQKTTLLLEPLKFLYGGDIYIDRSSNTFKWYVTKQEDILNLIEYFKLFPCRSFKVQRLHLIPRFYYLKSLQNNLTFDKSKNLFFHKWDSYSVE